MSVPDKPATVAGRRPITGRAIVLGALVVVLIVLLASPLHRFFASRGDASAAIEQLRDDQRRLAELQKQAEMWDDPGYIEQQARKQLQYAMPGDTVYVVVDAGAESDIEKTTGKSAAQSPTSWNTKLWSSVEAAGG